jgi:hypothetical protein
MLVGRRPPAVLGTLATLARPQRHFAKRARLARGGREPHGAVQSIAAAWSKAPHANTDDARLRENTLVALPLLGARELTVLLEHFAASGVGCGPPWEILWKELGKAAVPLLPGQTGTALTTWAHSFASAGVHSPSLFDAVARAAEPRILDACSPRELSALARSFAFTAHAAPTCMAAIGDAAASRLDGGRAKALSSSQLGTLMWAMAAADVPAPSLFGSDAFAAYVEGTSQWSDVEVSA